MSYHFHTDNWYTSLPLYKYLHQHGTLACGTIRSNQKGLPKQVKNAKLKKGEVMAIPSDVKVRRTLYLSLVKSQLTYATVVWSPARVNLRTILQRVQRRATRWILRTRIGEMSYKQLDTTYDIDMPCTWFLFHNCPFHRS